MSAGSNMEMKESTARWPVDHRSSCQSRGTPRSSSTRSNPAIETAFPIAFTCAHEGTETALSGNFKPAKSWAKNNRQRIHMASHLHNTTRECPYDHSAARSQNRAKLWWSDNIPDFQRPFPAPSSTKVVSMESVRHWISRVKDVALKVPFEPPQE